MWEKAVAVTELAGSWVWRGWQMGAGIGRQVNKIICCCERGSTTIVSRGRGGWGYRGSGFRQVIPDVKGKLTGKDPMLGKINGKGKGGNRG